MPFGDWTFTSGGETVTLVTPFVPPAPDTVLPVTVVRFTQATLDEPSADPDSHAERGRHRTSGRAVGHPDGAVM